MTASPRAAQNKPTYPTILLRVYNFSLTLHAVSVVFALCARRHDARAREHARIHDRLVYNSLICRVFRVCSMFAVFWHVHKPDRLITHLSCECVCVTAGSHKRINANVQTHHRRHRNHCTHAIRSACFLSMLSCCCVVRCMHRVCFP